MNFALELASIVAVLELMDLPPVAVEFVVIAAAFVTMTAAAAAAAAAIVIFAAAAVVIEIFAAALAVAEPLVFLIVVSVLWLVKDVLRQLLAFVAAVASVAAI